MELVDLLETGAHIVLAAALVCLSILSCNLIWLTTAYWRLRRTGQTALAPAGQPAETGAETENATALPRVLVQIPVFNERHVVRRILAAVAALDWPRDRLTIQLLDDSTDDTAEIAAAAVAELADVGVDVVRLSRTDRQGFKAGALQNGLAVTDHPFIAIFDADFIPRPDFLRRTMGSLLADPRLAFVQGRWEHLNGEENRLTRAQTLMLDAHFAIEQPARSMAGLPLAFNGTCGVWRRAAIEDAGGWRADTLTEDLDLALRAHLRGWRAVFLPDVTVPGELPAALPAWRVQQFRWTKGFAQVARKLLPAIWRSPFRPAVKIAVSLQLLQCLFYPLAALAVCNTILFLTAGLAQPLALQVLGVTSTVLGICGTAGFLLSGRIVARRSRLGHAPADLVAVMALNAGLALSNSRAVAEALLGRRSAFMRTPKKGGQTASGYRSAGATGLPEIVCAVFLLGLMTMELAWYVPFLAVSGVGLLIVGAALALDRFHPRLPASIRMPGGTAPARRAGQTR